MIVDRLRAHYQDLFVYEKPEVIHPHDRLLEKLFLRFLPSSITPNALTMIRILLTPAVFLVISAENYRLGLPFFLLVAFTDALDGSLARTRGQITRFGMLFDPLADKFLIGSMVMLLVFRYLDPFLALAVLGVEIVLILSALVAKAKFKTVRMANIWGKIKMMLQVLAVFLTLIGLALTTPSLLGIAAWLFGLAIGFAVISLFSHGL